MDFLVKLVRHEQIIIFLAFRAHPNTTQTRHSNRPVGLNRAPLVMPRGQMTGLESQAAH